MSRVLMLDTRVVEAHPYRRVKDITLPSFAKTTSASPSSPTLKRHAAAARLGLHVAMIDKMIRAGMLTVPITVADVDRLTNWPWLEVVSGELTVLRTDAAQPADMSLHPTDTRMQIGFSVHHTDAELEATSLRWWRSEPQRVLENELFAVTVSTFPVALYLITGHEAPQKRVGEDFERYHYRGKLLARVTPGMVVRTSKPSSGELTERVQQVMSSRIKVNSGGPVGYLSA